MATAPPDAVGAIGPRARLRAVVLPPIAWLPDRAAYRAGAVAPDPFELERQLATHGIDTVLLDPGRFPLNPLAGRGTLIASLDPLRATRVLFSQRRANIVVSIFEGAALPITMLASWTRFRVPVVLWDLGLTEDWQLRQRILDRVIPRVDGVFVLSASQKSYVESRWHRRNGVERLGHSIDTAFFAPAPLPPATSILSVGDDAGRDYPTLLAAAAQIAAPIVIKSATLAPDHPRPPNVAVRHDRISHDALRSLYAQSSFSVVPLHQTLNASGVSTILETGAMGRALVVSENVAIRDFIIPDETCLTVPCNNPAALAAAMNRLLHEPETCARLGANARAFVERNFAQSVFAARLATLLRQYAA